MTQEVHSMTPEAWIKLGGEVLVFASIIFAVIKYVQERKREFQKRFFEEQLKVYSEAVNAASIISLSNKDETEYKNAEMDFKRLYWGKMCMIEDKDVEGRMRQFNDVLDIYRTTSEVGLLEKLQEQLKLSARALAHTCRDSSINTWEINYKLKRFNSATTDFHEDQKRVAKSETKI
jgi:hypothetical protein